MEYHEKVEKFENFFREVYDDEVSSAVSSGERAVVVDFNEFSKFDNMVAETLLDHPEEGVDAAEEAVENLPMVESEMIVHFENLPSTEYIVIRNLRSRHIGKFIGVKGIIKRASEVRPELQSAIFECNNCGDRYEKEQDSAKITTPHKCDCGSRSFDLVDKVMQDVQTVTIEENPENIRGAEQPRKIGVVLRDDLVDPQFQNRVVPGNKVIINGILREKAIKKESKRFDLYIEANYLETIQREFEEIEIDEEEEEAIKEISEDDDLIEKIVASIAPSIHGHTQIKEAIALQLFSGVRKERPDGTNTRGDIHVLLIGEPGTGKCVSPDTEVFMCNGKKEKISDLVNEAINSSEEVKEIDDGVYVEEETELLGMDESGKIENKKCSKMWKREVPEKMLRIKTSSGREIEVTPSHPLFIQKHGNIVGVRADRLCEGNFIAAPRKMVVDREDEINITNRKFRRVESFDSELDTDTEVIPNLGEILRETREMLEMSQFDFSISRGTYQHYERLDRNPSRRNLCKIVGDFEERLEKLEEMMKSLEKPDWNAVKQVRKEINVSQNDLAQKTSVTQSSIEKYERNVHETNEGKVLTNSVFYLVEKIKKMREAKYNVEKLRDLANSDIFWDKIEEITEIDPEYDYVYDLEVPEDHNYVSNGVFSHNSQLLKFTGNLAPKGKYVVGKAATAAGITATVMKDEITDEWTLEAGALVLANKGIATIDEIDKMEKTDRSSMHEAMEQQSITVSKANIQATLQCRTSILAAGNPKFGRFDPYRPVAEQIEISDTLISRFDLLFPVKDIPDASKDRKLSDHIMSMHTDPKDLTGDISLERLRNYIAYAKRNVRPKMSEKAQKKLKDFYVDTRQKGTGGDEGQSKVPITARQLEAIIRLSEASARLRLNDTVEEKDAQRAIDLLTYSLKKIGVISESGEYDIDKLETGMDSESRSKRQTIMKVVDELSGSSNENIPYEELIETLEDEGIDKETAEEVIDELMREGELYEPKNGYINVI